MTKFILVTTMGLASLVVHAQSAALHWSHEPKNWTVKGETLKETVPTGTDYWRLGSAAPDNAPFRYQEQSGNFEAVVQVTGNYHEQSHQAGLMIRIDEKTWIKTGIEYVDGKQNISAVVTRGYSDWSVIPQQTNHAALWIRAQRQNDAIKLEYSFDGNEWTMFRLAYFPPQVSVKVGMYASAPGKASFDATFDHFHVGTLNGLVKDE